MKLRFGLSFRSAAAGILAVVISITPLAAFPSRKDKAAGTEPANEETQRPIPASAGKDFVRAFYLVRPLDREDKEPRKADKKTENKEPTCKRRFGRAWAELGLVMAYSQTRYWIEYAKFIEDWQFRLTWKDQRRRIFTLEAVRFDSNNFSINWIHAFAGVLYYNVARSNNLTWPQSLLYCMAGSLWWEYVAEWREVISINDNILTGIGGFAAGESWYQLGKYFAGRKGLFYSLLAFTNPAMKINHRLDRKNGKSPSLGPEPGWHEFRFLVGQKSLASSTGFGIQGTLFTGFHTQFIHVPEYGRPGQSQRMIADTLASEIDVDFAFRRGKYQEVNFFSRVAGLGYYVQKIDENSSGHAYYIGLVSGFTLFKKRPVWIFDQTPAPFNRGVDLRLEEPRNFRDKLAIVQIAGPTFDYTIFAPKSRLRFVFDATLDFGLINSFALNTYSKDHDIGGFKSTLLYYGYYFGLGTTVSSGFNYQCRGIEFNGHLKYQAYGSIEGRDRVQKQITDDVHVKDSRVSYGLGAAVRVPGTPFELLGAYEGIDRRGVIRGLHHRGLENRVSVLLSYRF